MQLSVPALTFYAVENSGVSPPAQTVAIYNLFGGDLSWTTQVPYITGNQSWLSVTPSGDSFGIPSPPPGQATF